MPLSPSTGEGRGEGDKHHFYVGYSPERINSGDKQHRLTTITKITSGSTPEAAAGSKWNFLPFRPGLIGGHCIGVDPYYLIHKAQEVGCHPEMILAGRRINDGMGQYIATQVVKLMLSRGLGILDAPILVLGLTFKENCPDLRNTRVVDLVAELRSFGARVDVHDPWADPDEAREEYGLDLIQPQTGHYRAIVLAVAHDQYRSQGVATLRAYGQPGAVVYDVEHVFPADEVDGRL